MNEEDINMQINKKILPSLIITNHKLYKILSIVDPDLIIKNYSIIIKHGKIKKVKIVGRHPNANDLNNEFCLPTGVIGKQLNSDIIKFIEYLISTYFLDNCYFRPYGMITYKKI